MKFRLLSAATCTLLAMTATAKAQQVPRPPATYAQVLADTRKLTSEYDLALKMGARAVALDLVSFGAGSDALYQRGHKQNEIGFVCDRPFPGGVMTGTIVRSEATTEGGRFYLLKDCMQAHKK